MSRNQLNISDYFKNFIYCQKILQIIFYGAGPVSIKKMFQNEVYTSVLNVINDGLYFIDNQGTTLWLNDASEKILDMPRGEMIGKNVVDLERQGIMQPSVTRMVLEKRNTISTIQSSSKERKYMVTGHLITISGEELIMAHSRDITQAVETSNQLEETENLLKLYSQQIRHIQSQKHSQINEQFLGAGKSFTVLMDLIQKAAGVNTTVILTGETGVGKNTVAEQIHELSDRCKHPLVHINCGSIPETLIESELFGYKKGSFTGAHAGGKTGLVTMADKGTLFLDEISELPLHLQPKLLQLLQNKTFLPVGATSVQSADIRIIAATHSDLFEMVQKGTFREDLYYRLNILPIRIPPLREREEDIVSFLHMNLTHFNKKHSQNKSFAPGLIDKLQNYSWPGNIRELENLVERLVITSKFEEITEEDLPEKMRESYAGGAHKYMQEKETLPEAVERMEREIVYQALEKHQTTRRAAEALGITQSAIMRRIKKYDLTY